MEAKPLVVAEAMVNSSSALQVQIRQILEDIVQKNRAADPPLRKFRMSVVVHMDLVDNRKDSNLELRQDSPVLLEAAVLRSKFHRL